MPECSVRPAHEFRDRSNWHTLRALLAVLVLAAGHPARAEGPALDQNAALRLSQEAVGRSPGDYTLLDREGRPVKLAAYRGKPLLVSFIYTGCFQICPTTTRNLDRTIAIAQATLGAGSFNVVSIGFNQPFDSPQALKSFAAQHGIDRPNWEFLSPPRDILDDLTRDFGFSYVATAAGFDHIMQVTVVDAQGRIVRQVYGETLGADMLVEPLKQLLTGAPLSQMTDLPALIERVRILCSVYDPTTGRYRVNYSLFLEVAGGLTFLIWLAGFYWRERRNRRMTSA